MYMKVMIDNDVFKMYLRSSIPHAFNVELINEMEMEYGNGGLRLYGMGCLGNGIARKGSVTVVGAVSQLHSFTVTQFHD
jgi:hypothetical protein